MTGRNFCQKKTGLCDIFFDEAVSERTGASIKRSLSRFSDGICSSPQDVLLLCGGVYFGVCFIFHTTMPDAMTKPSDLLAGTPANTANLQTTFGNFRSHPASVNMTFRNFGFHSTSVNETFGKFGFHPAKLPSRIKKYSL